MGGGKNSHGNPRSPSPCTEPCQSSPPPAPWHGITGKAMPEASKEDPGLYHQKMMDLICISSQYSKSSFINFIIIKIYYIMNFSSLNHISNYSNNLPTLIFSDMFSFKPLCSPRFRKIFNQPKVGGYPTNVTTVFLRGPHRP